VLRNNIIIYLEIAQKSDIYIEYFMHLYTTIFGCTDAHFFKTDVEIVTVTSVAYLDALRYKYLN